MGTSVSPWPWVDSLETWLDDLLRPGDVNVVRDGTNTAGAYTRPLFSST